MTGAELITEERNRQITEEYRTPEEDERYTMDELALAAVCYTLPPHMSHVQYEPEGWGCRWFKPTSRIRDLTKAGALIAAEIDRLLRKEQKGE